MNTRPVADRYAATDEKIVEFSSVNGGGLISLRLVGGELHVEVYRLDSTVRVSVGGGTV